MRDARTEAIVVAATVSPAGVGGIALRLTPWGFDDLVEYLHASGHAQCNSILSRIASAGSRTWTPEIARVLLERFAADPLLTTPDAAIAAEIRAHLPNFRQFTAAAQYCLAVLSARGFDINSALKDLDRIPLSAAHQKAASTHQRPTTACGRAPRRHDFDAIVAEQFVETPSSQLNHPNRTSLPRKRPAVQYLRHVLKSRRDGLYHPMAASILRHADPTWRPAALPTYYYHFDFGYFDNVDWPDVSLKDANLRETDFTNANLQNCNMVDAQATVDHIRRSRSPRRWLAGIHACRANFETPNLSTAKLSIAELAHASFAKPT